MAWQRAQKKPPPACSPHFQQRALPTLLWACAGEAAEALPDMLLHLPEVEQSEGSNLTSRCCAALAWSWTALHICCTARFMMGHVHPLLGLQLQICTLQALGICCLAEGTPQGMSSSSSSHQGMQSGARQSLLLNLFW